jgi:D-3-phosphoglycerate dehydrogenase
MEEVSNQAVTMILCLNRQLIQFNENVKNGKWGRDDLMPIEPIDQQVLGLVGLGNIGRQVARKMFNGWRMKVIAYDPYCPPWIAQEYAVEQVFSLHELFERSDYISVQIPLNKETHHLMRKEHFDCMKPTAFFVNVCRGGVVREVDLIQALREGKMRGAGLDVFEQEPVDPNNPLLKMDNVIVAPHSAGASTRSAWLARQRASQQVAAVLRGNWPSAGQNPEVASTLQRRDRMQSLEPKLEASREVLPMAVLPEG